MTVHHHEGLSAVLTSRHEGAVFCGHCGQAVTCQHGVSYDDRCVECDLDSWRKELAELTARAERAARSILRLERAQRRQRRDKSHG
jgi:hypothetical protein